MLKDLLAKITGPRMTEIQRGQVTNQTQADALQAADELRNFSASIVEKFVAADETASDVNAGTPGSVYANLDWKQQHPTMPERFDQRHRWQGSLSSSDQGQTFKASGTHVIDTRGPVNCEGSPTLHDCRLTQTTKGGRTEIHLVDVEQYEFSPVVTEQWAIFEGDKVSYGSRSR